MKKVNAGVNPEAMHRRNAEIVNADCRDGGREQAGTETTKQCAEDDGQHEQDQQGTIVEVDYHGIAHCQRRQGDGNRQPVSQPRVALPCHQTNRQLIQQFFATALAGGRHCTQRKVESNGRYEDEQYAFRSRQPEQRIDVGEGL